MMERYKISSRAHTTTFFQLLYLWTLWITLGEMKKNARALEKCGTRKKILSKKIFFDAIKTEKNLSPHS